MAYEFVSGLTGHQHSVSSVRFSPDGKLLASTSADKTARVWDMDPTSEKYLQCILVLRGHERGVNDCCWSPYRHGDAYSGHYLCTASDDKTLKVWDLEKGVEVSTLRKHEHYVSCCAWSPKGNMIASGSYDETVEFWSVNDGGTPVRALPAHSDPVTGVAFCPDGTLLASASLDGLCRIWNVDTGHCLRTVMPYASAGSTPPPLCAVLYPAANFLVLSSMDGSMWLYDYGRKEFLRRYKGLENRHHILAPTLALMKRGGKQLVISGSENNDIIVWDVNAPAQNQTHVQVIQGRKDAQVAGEGPCGIPICVNAHNDVLAAGCKEPDFVIRIWKWKG